MAFFGVSTSASNMSVSAVSGAGGLFDFATAGTKSLLRGDVGAPAAVVVAGDPRGSFPSSDTSQRLTSDKVQALEAMAYFSAGFTAGVAGPLPWNAGGGAANISEAVRYKVTSASGNSITCTGPHPQRIDFVVLSANPDWPAEGEPKFIQTTVYGSIPIGAEIRPLPPSVLANKMIGIITAISAPATYSETVTVTFTTTGSFDNIDAPLDAALGEFDPFVDVYFYRTAAPIVVPQAWAPNASAWTRVTLAKTRVEVPTLDEDGCFELTGPGGTEHRIALHPGTEGTGAATFAIATLTWRQADGSFVEADDLALRWRPVYSSGTHTSRIYLADLYDIGGESALVSFVVSYWTEYRSGDDAGNGLLRHPRACVNSRPFTGYANAGGADTGQACWAQEDASGAALGLFHRDCHLPLCDRFSAVALDGTVVNGTEASGDPIALPGRYSGGGDLWDRLMVASDITFVEFFVPGSTVAQMYVERVSRGQPSLAWLSGPWFQIERGLFTTREPLVGPLFGQRETYTDGDGGEHHQLVFGAFWKSAWSDGSEVQDAFDASDFEAAAPGLFPANVDFTDRTPPTGTAYPPAVAGVDEFLPPHCGGRNQYSGAITAANPGNRIIAVTNSEKWSLSVTTTSEENATLAEQIDFLITGL
jgi:hypothetical protein